MALCHAEWVHDVIKNRSVASDDNLAFDDDPFSRFGDGDLSSGFEDEKSASEDDPSLGSPKCPSEFSSLLRHSNADDEHLYLSE